MALMPLSDVRRLAARFRRNKHTLNNTRDELNAAILKAREEGETYADIAQAAGMSAMTIFNTVNGRRYR